MSPSNLAATIDGNNQREKISRAITFARAINTDTEVYFKVRDDTWQKFTPTELAAKLGKNTTVQGTFITFCFIVTFPQTAAKISGAIWKK